ncbi:nucleotide sugar dehydrogenase [Nitrososphaera sp.]|uniref:nucleotide sugar dehydrogenase n=1 Tax=Nitrososphaera sp. TaxID=1971748 RepID=UPI0017DDA705|nr:nucleotide sugar dehydrogenase [Nitrososphaera sp.]NWG37860.1 nucleotide sugar dehydrogenase [Nitrososphaera sp.]
MKKAGRRKGAVAELASRIRSGKTRIAVYGLGHVGSPIAAVWLRFGAHVIGVDKSPSVLESARKGRTHIPEPGVAEAFSKGLKEKRFFVYDDPVKASQDSSIKMICVPVLTTGQSLSADLGAVKQVASSIAKGLKKGDIVVLNPSVPPGTSEDAVVPVLEKESGLKAERDFLMVYSPERIYEGRAIKDIEDNYPAIVSGAGPASLAAGAALFSLVFKKGVMTMSSMRTAEAEKLLEGVYRDVNIALANELALFCEKAGVDFWEAREGANSQPFCHIHKPGVGVGGACIPVYPQFILHTADMVKADCNITRLGRNVNDSMPAHCVRQALSLCALEPAQCSVAILGLAFRGGVSDTRLSPTYAVVSELKRLGAKEIRVHDPMVKSDSALPADVMLTQDLARAVKGADLVILATDHAEYRNLSKKELGDAPVYDGRGMLDGSKFTRFASIGRRT